jgi:hypothetical protein
MHTIIYYYTIPRSAEQQLQQNKKIVRLVNIGFLEKYYSSKWLPYYQNLQLLRKNGTSTIRVVTDFKKLNLFLKHRMLPISILKIWHMICSIEGFTFESALDLNMGYYHINLDVEAQQLCTIVLP